MNYRGKKIAITGVPGFIGSALADRLEALAKPANDNSFDVPGQYKYITVLDGDVRDPKTFKKLDHTFDYLFHFGAPSSQVLFKRQPAYCIESTVKGLMHAADAARRHGIRLIYPSTGLLSQGKINEYALCKLLSEQYVAGLGIDALGIRIFATYGPGEGHKADYASVPYLFARDMVDGKAPVIFGDGTQVRDFIFIDDVVNAVLRLAEECHDPIVDVGSGLPVSFNDLIDALNVLIFRSQTKKYIEPMYQDAPAGYVQETGADPNTMARYWKPQFDLNAGLQRLVDSLIDNPTPAKKEKVTA
jgi:UDP-glucose 4-epimerase